jgi:PKD repeat protein
MNNRRLTLGVWSLLLVLLGLAGYSFLGQGEPGTLPMVQYDGVVRVASAPDVKGLEPVQPTKVDVPVSGSVKPSGAMSLDGAVVVPVAAASPAKPTTVAAATTKPRPKFEAAADVSDDRLAEAAVFAKMDFAEFKKQAMQDRDLKVNAKNRPFYVCEGLAVAPGVKSGAGNGVGAGDAKAPVAPRDDFIAVDAKPEVFTGPSFPVTATGAFQLHSRPGAARVIYLDFTGHTTPATTDWANDYNSGAAFTTPPFQLDSTASPGDQINLDAIRDIWLRVSEDYAAWDVDVTTEQPPATALGQRCVIGGSFNDWLNISCGGISHISSFGALLDGTDEPNFVFVDGTGSSVNGAQVAISHELGHSVGLSHMGEVARPGVAAKGYSSGHTVAGHTAVSSCGPIMGACYGVPLVQWSRGEYPYANNAQDEIAVINTFLAPRTSLALDDHKNTLATATVVPGRTLGTGGILASSTDVDLFKIGAGAGWLSVSTAGARAYPNVKIFLQLLDSGGAVVASSYNATSMSSVLTYNVPVKGFYYIKVIGVGFAAATPIYSGTGVAQTVVGNTAGWTNYGSIGRYNIAGSWNLLVYAPVAVITSDRTGGVFPVTVAFDGRTSYDPDGTVASYSWDFGDPASGPSNTSSLATPAHTYSAPGTFTASLIVTDNVGNASVAATKVITVSGTALPKSVNVASMTASWIRMTNVEVAGSSVIRVVNQYGQPLRSVAVYVTVTGSASGKAAAKTDANGFVTIQMPKQRMTNPSTYTFTVTSLVYPAYLYKPSANLPTPASVTITR